jgi:dTDP-4-dehydrorhamnose 3,5-epimerase
VATISSGSAYSFGMTISAPSVCPIDPASLHLDGIDVLPRVLHYDARGFLLETLRRDDRKAQGDHFAMSYTSVTTPGQFRDRDRWHVHRVQTDRFVVVLGEMTLALYDARANSSTRGRLEVVRMCGAPFDRPARETTSDAETFLVPIPPGVYHCIGNLSRLPFALVNFPTELYDAQDEGRVPFADVSIDRLQGPFSWDRVTVDG